MVGQPLRMQWAAWAGFWVCFGVGLYLLEGSLGWEEPPGTQRREDGGKGNTKVSPLTREVEGSSWAFSEMQILRAAFLEVKGDACRLEPALPRD